MQHVVSQLITKKQELLGELKYHREKVEQTEEILKSIDLSIKVFDPDFKIENIKAKNLYKKKHYFKHGESHRLILDLFRRDSKPKTTTDITIELMKFKKLDYENLELLENVQKSIIRTLHNQEKQGLLKSGYEGVDNILTWSLK